MGKNLFYKSSQFALFIKQEKNSANIQMDLSIPLVNTCDIPNASAFIKLNCPSVLTTACFNEKNLPFDKEVEATEIGHLFEHILLDELCLQKIASGFDAAVFNGRTDWNWEKDPQGTFHIYIDLHKRDSIFLSIALNKTISIIEALLETSMPQATYPQAEIAHLEAISQPV